MSSSNETNTLCPSARSDWEGSQIIGVVGGGVDTPIVSYFKQKQPLLDSIDKLKGKVTPEEVFRFAAPCAKTNCQHFNGNDCRLVVRVVENLPTVSEHLPPCIIRSDCQWWQQKGRDACMRCPQVITENYYPTEAMVVVSIP